MPAMTIGHHVEKSVGFSSPPTSCTRMTRAVRRVCPEFRMPASSSSCFIHVSASSRRSVGVHASMARKTPADFAFDRMRPRWVTASSTSRSVDFPHCFVGLVMRILGQSGHSSIR
jgi:hypothetical protein